MAPCVLLSEVSDRQELVERCRQGDQLAWERLVRDHQGRAYAVAYHYVRNQDVARDLAQEAFVRVYQKLDSYAGQDFLQIYFYSFSTPRFLLRLPEYGPPESEFHCPL